MNLGALHPIRTVRGKFFFLHLSILAPFVVAGVVTVGNAAIGERDRMIGQLEERANRVMSTSAAIAQEETTVLKTVGELPPIERGQRAEMSEVLSAMLSHHPLVNNLHAIDAGGEEIAAAVDAAGAEESWGENDVFQEVMKSGQPAVGAAKIALEGRASGQPIAPFAVPLRNRAGRQVGVLIAELILSEIQRLVMLGPDPSGGYVYIVDRAGQVIAHPNLEYARSLRDFSQVPVVRQYLAGEDDSSEFFDPIQNASVVAVYKRTPLAGWGVISIYPSAVISATMARTGFSLLVVFGVSLIFALVAAYTVGNRLADRIVDLAARARAVGEGQVGSQVEPVSRDEIGMLARSLNTISARLGEQLSRLEDASRDLKNSCEDVGVALASGLDAEEAVRLAMLSSARLIGVETAVGLIVEDGGNLRVVKALGPIPPQLVGRLWPVNDHPSILGKAASQCQIEQVRDMQLSDLPPDPVIMLGREQGFRTALVVPMAAYGRCMGAIVLYDVRAPRELSQEEISRVQTIANEAAMAIETARLQHQIRLSNEQFLLAGLRLRTIIETIPEGVVVADAPGGNITMSNTAAELMLGQKIVPEADLHEQPRVYHLYRTEGRLYQDEELPLYRSVVHGETDTTEIVIKRPDGTNITVLFSSAPLKAGDGQVIGGVGVFRDITDVKELDRLKDEFISITSHELKSPLTVVRGYAQLLRRKVLVKPENQEEIKWLQAIDDQSSRLSTLVERLLDVSRIQTGRLELKREPVDLVALIRRVAEQEQVTTTLHQIRVFAEVPELVGNWDKFRLEQVLINMVDNAIKYSPQGGPIDIAVRQVGDEAQVSVRDCGIGISREDQRRIFERFYRARTGRERPSGLGLGLYISYEIVTVHGGRMWVESEVGKGSMFYFSLPLNHGKWSDI